MEILGFLVLIIWLLVIPTYIGGIPAAFVDKQGKSPAFMCISGYMIMWAVFQIVCVPCVLLEERYTGMFPYVVYGFGGVALLLAVAGGILTMRKCGRGEGGSAGRDGSEGGLRDGSEGGLKIGSV